MIQAEHRPKGNTVKKLLKLDKKLFGAYGFRPEPCIDDLCLIHDGKRYYDGRVINVTPDTFTAAYIDDADNVLLMAYVPKCRFRPVML